MDSMLGSLASSIHLQHTTDNKNKILGSTEKTLYACCKRVGRLAKCARILKGNVALSLAGTQGSPLSNKELIFRLYRQLRSGCGGLTDLDMMFQISQT